MKLYVEHNRVLVSTNIYGKPLEYKDEYYIYRKFLGIFRLYLTITNRRYEKYYIRWMPKHLATIMDKTDVDECLDALKSNPDNFIREK